jgi:predicted ArsR family transcriptional regulator
MYFNSTSQAGDLLIQYTKKAISQNEAIAAFMCSRKAASPSQVQSELFRNAVPLTSVRRAMTTLSDEGLLIKLDKTVIGQYGRPEHLWRYKT